MTARIPVPPSWPTARPQTVPRAAPQQQAAPQQGAWVGQQQWTGQQPGQQSWPAYTYPPGAPHRVAGASRLSHRSLIAILTGAVAGVALILIVASIASKPGQATQCQGLTCSVPLKTGPPVETGTLYTNPKFGFSARAIESPLVGIAPKISTANNELTLTYTAGGNFVGEVQVAGVADSNGQSAEQIVDSTINNVAQGGQQLVYNLSGAMIGYQPGFGAVYDFTPNSSDGQSSQFRVVVIAAIVNKLAVIAVAAGPFVQFGQNAGDGHPSPVDTFIAGAADPVINSVLWPGQTSLFP